MQALRWGVPTSDWGTPGVLTRIAHVALLHCDFASDDLGLQAPRWSVPASDWGTAVLVFELPKRNEHVATIGGRQ